MIGFSKPPFRCMLCTGPVSRDDLPICTNCIHKLSSVLTARCEECQKGLLKCECKKSDNFKSLFFYKDNFLTHRLIYRIKEDLDARYMDFLAELMFYANEINPKLYNAVTFVPRKPIRKRRSGHDQAEQFAKAIERRFGIPVIYTLERVGGRQQKNLSARERFSNIKGRYRLRADLPEEKFHRILLVDDLCTTGATVKACAKTLRGTVSHDVSIMLIARKG